MAEEKPSKRLVRSALGARATLEARCEGGDRVFFTARRSSSRRRLRSLAAHPVEGVRYVVGENPATPPEALGALAKDESWKVRSAVAGNVAAPPEALAALAEERSSYLRWRVGSNRSTPPSTLWALSLDADPDVRRAARSNPEVPLEALGHLPLARLPTGTLERLSAHPSWDMIQVLADRWTGTLEELRQAVALLDPERRSVTPPPERSRWERLLGAVTGPRTLSR